jgi:uncharacterized Zn-binding protein involved in type VI secretion
MAGVSRNNDTAGGDLIPSQATVFVNEELVIVDGDGVAAHGLSPHTAQTISSGTQSTVSINGIDIVVVGDTADVCGEVATGSSTVTIG